MKKTLFAIAAACVALVACNKDQDTAEIINPSKETGSISVELVFDGAVTKAINAYTETPEYEQKVNSIQLFVFGEDGKIQSYKNLSGTELTNKASTISVIKGKKDVWAVINGKDLKNITTVNELKQSAVALSDNSTDLSKGFVMAGFNKCEVTASTEASCSILVSRLASRVVLAKIENQCPVGYGGIKIKSVFLTNVVGNQQIDGNATPKIWYNPYGRNDSTNSDHLIGQNNYSGGCPALTFKDLSSASAIANAEESTSPHFFYSFANSSTNVPVLGNGAPTIPEAGAMSKLVIYATVNGTDCYYPINLTNKLARNTSYTVGVTITGPGSTDPDTPVEKGNINATITVDKWISGPTYDEII